MTMPSEVRELKDKIRQLKEAQLMCGTVILHQITRVVREADFLDEHQKDKLISLIWHGREGK